MILRFLYKRFGVLPILRHIYLHYKLIALTKIQYLWNSADNLKAVQALSNRRFQKQALLTAIGLTDVTAWPEIIISTISYNSLSRINTFIESLLSQSYPLSKIHLRFVDHGSTDYSVPKLEKVLSKIGSNFASIQIIQQGNLGFGSGHDVAIKAGTSDYCLVTNLDIKFLPDSLCEVVRVALSDTHKTVASWELRQTPYEHPKYYDPVTLETNWSSHACVLIRRSAYAEVGGYDTGVFLYAEDVELSYRFRSYGYTLKYVPNAIVRQCAHKHSADAKHSQYFGSKTGNIYIRFRYGNILDKLSGLVLYAAYSIRPSVFLGTKTLLPKDVLKLATLLPAGKGSIPAYFPLRGFDYEMARDWDWEFSEIKARPVVAPPLVTIITRTYKGRAMFLEQAMQSVFNQTYPTIELLVVEDGGDSQQDLVTCLSGRSPPGCRVRFLAHEKLGRSAAGNAALAAANGRFLMFLDDDDLLFADHVETLVSALSQDSGLSAAYALAMEVHTQISMEKSTYLEVLFHTPGIFKQEWNYGVLLDHNFISIQAILFKRELYEQRGGFDTSLNQLEDWNLWLRYGHGNRFLYVPKTTSLFRSPADLETRLSRHAILHTAYDDAKNRAFKCFEQV